ncbi:MAG: DUF1836 domain-containing protein [Furfurilactobacillus sp.]|jgi:hypothetical protein|uniref:DUF1836 domain-containing protein n=1 Tax=Furfurilactobacillus sp. TaxID=2767911 RepID=UPI00258602BE|nr:DUF1836 domain-containing protein [Furfurilactobacillus sp.]MCH4011689.1 DUF1836 domain-containing protein [Furfurilactobacillus sp.]MCH4037581.1 DUF1836 domain-containing protein [Furfurilactobacillus sp.]MCH4115783.1 DUF1836 domain-containing protein [Furfurilactobacillus sp.]MCI1339856.1 DUF1836 domain-containing protein [Furfurilactobacillus sp.]MCI1386996.1 DUF1836 domain-containing protein [Furfurilactobacillus sp.]
MSNPLNQSFENDNLMILPHWSDLPGFDLHLDQLIELTNGYLRPITGDIVTKIMMHNYFKADVLVAPDKKSYHKIHLAGAIIVGLLKNIFSLEELRVALQYIIDNESPQKSYDHFITLFNREAANDSFKHFRLAEQQQQEMSAAEVIRYDALEAFLFWLSAKKALHRVIDANQQ